MRTSSLRRRVVATTLVVMASLLLAVGVFVDVSLGARLRADAQDRLTRLADLAVALDGSVDDQTLVNRLETAGANVALIDGDTTVVGRPDPLAPGNPPARATPPPAGRPEPPTVTEEGGVLKVERPLARGRTLELTTSTAPVQEALARFRVLMLLGSLAGLLLAGSVTWWAAGRALRPLDVLTATARSIAAGDRGRRLAPDRTSTELGRAAGAFDEMLDELEGAVAREALARKRLQDFLSDASHELRTPLAGVLAGAESLLLQDENADVDDQRLARELTAVGIVREARRAGRLVADLLTASRLQEVVAHPEEFDLTAVVAALAADVRARSGSGDAVLEVVGAPGVGVRADRQHVVQVLQNLLDNARRAARPGVVRMQVLAGGCAGGDGARVVVSDTGPGVPADQRERVFERLVRLDEARVRGDGGAGLGLSIARGLARAQGGDLRCVGPGDPGLPPGTLPGAVFVLTLAATPG